MEDIWWQITVPLDQTIEIVWEEIGYELIELGASGTEITEEFFKVYFTNSQFHQPSIENYLVKKELVNYSYSQLKNENWVAMCEDLFRPVQIKDIIIQPIFDYQLRAKEEGKIHIIPGMGFGSGHHETSQMLSAILQDLPLRHDSPLDILDFGTGSGILSLVANEVFSEAKILAVDNDPQALLNAEDNLKVNQLKQQITLSKQDLKELDTTYDIILANIYLEVLRNYQSELIRLLKPNGYLLISGITLDQDKTFQETFRAWEYLQSNSLGNWKSYLLKKVN